MQGWLFPYYAAKKGFWIYIGTNEFVWTQIVKNRMKGGTRSFDD